MGSAVLDAFLACLFTYGLTALGAAGVFVFDTYGHTNKTSAVMAVAVGLMLSAVMDLLNECLEVSTAALGVFSWVPVVVGTVLGCIVLVGVDKAMVCCVKAEPSEDATTSLAAAGSSSSRSNVSVEDADNIQLTSVSGRLHSSPMSAEEGVAGSGAGARQAVHREHLGHELPDAKAVREAWLLFFALAVQHIPEALAMGVAFADAEATQEFGTAVSVTLAIGLQDIPEGMAAALVLRHVGISKKKSFWLGQATGLVQPVSGVLGALAVLAVKAALPYALAFAGACMLFVVVKDMLPDCMNVEDKMVPSLLVMVGFTIMMTAGILINSIRI